MQPINSQPRCIDLNVSRIDFGELCLLAGSQKPPVRPIDDCGVPSHRDLPQPKQNNFHTVVGGQAHAKRSSMVYVRCVGVAHDVYLIHKTHDNCPDCGSG